MSSGRKRKRSHASKRKSKLQKLAEKESENDQVPSSHDLSSNVDPFSAENETTNEESVSLENDNDVDSLVPKSVQKFYNMRLRLWSKFDQGIQMDETAYYSVTPEKIAIHLAQRICQNARIVVVDGFAGVAGNSIQFALQPNCAHVFAVELDKSRCRMAQHNASVYGAQDKITFLNQDFMHAMQFTLPALIRSIQKQEPGLEVVVFLAPPYGGTHATLTDEYDMNEMSPTDAATLVQMSITHLSSHICFLLPKNITHKQIGEIITKSNTDTAEYEENNVSAKCKTVSLYLGNLLVHPDRCTDQVELSDLEYVES